MFSFFSDMSGAQLFAFCFFSFLVLLVIIGIFKGQKAKPKSSATTPKSRTVWSDARKSFSWILTFVIVLLLGDGYISYLYPGIASWFFSGVGIAQFFFVLVLAVHLLIVRLAYVKRRVAAAVIFILYVLAAILLCRWFFVDEGTVKFYKTHEPTSTTLVQAPLLTQAINDSLEALEGAFDPSEYWPASEDSTDLAPEQGWPTSNLIIPEGEIYYVIVPLKAEVVEVENLRLEKGDRLDPLMCLVVRPQLPGGLALYDMTALGLVEYYQENGKALYLSVKNYPPADKWINRYTSRDKSIKDLFVRNDERNQVYAKNDNSVLGSLQLQLNGNWEWVRPTYAFQAADSAQPILLGANLQRGIGHEGASGYFRLIFRISHPIVVDSSTAKP